MTVLTTALLAHPHCSRWFALDQQGTYILQETNKLVEELHSTIKRVRACRCPCALLHTICAASPQELLCALQLRLLVASSSFSSLAFPVDDQSNRSRPLESGGGRSCGR